jgi:leucyl/phenylalanyl-tRNA--protein transferase
VLWGTARATWKALRGTLSTLYSLWRPLAAVAPGPDAPFPDPATAPRDGPLAAGGDLCVERLLAAYRAGIFPYYESPPILWWSPDPRAVFDLDRFHVSRRLARTVRSGRFQVTFDRDFDAVIRGCADRAEGTWITPEMIAAFNKLHRAGHAHSVEVRRGGDLVGGVYGVAIGGLFAGESMFSRARDASKVALVHLVERLRRRGYVLFDVQILNHHTASLGAVEVPRRVYLARLAGAVALDVTFGPADSA